MASFLKLLSVPFLEAKDALQSADLKDQSADLKKVLGIH